ncbi:glycosyltransferase family 2 protein [Pontibacter cellulosilyticus]|uniref:Glycosyltransferase n=1 Tax=Pontibacter cellulosilyticus TaxID=1720253 RepID=A0A923N3L0_9BACT|nr:glycosyltransferase [Pontibacter cellulosilyticus]MBC5991611.1 glycosyltransferase [Pontibacter cellulosilyticus]
MKSSDKPLISVIVPVKNGDAWLDKLLQSILNQTLANRTEIIVIDSGSTDDTLSILANYSVRLISISPENFNHGTTRNMGVEYAKGEFVVMTVQDAKPTDNKWLEHLLNGFDDTSVAGVCGQQVVPHDLRTNPVEWFRPISPPGKRKVYFKSEQEFLSLSPNERKSLCGWDNVNAMYKKEILLKHPFREVSFAEDALWAHDILKLGYSIVYNTNARVYHYHYETPDYTFRRSFTELYHRYKIFGTRPELPKNGLLTTLRHVKILLKEQNISWLEKYNWLIFNYNNRKASEASVFIFNQALSRGDEELEKQHDFYCKSVPQANKPITLI